MRENPANSKVDFAIQTASIDTKEPQRDAHLKSDDFFAAETHPTITFHSTSIASRGGDDYDVTGNLTVRGISKEVVLPVTHLGAAKDQWGIGLNWNAALEAGGFLVGDDVKVSLQIQAA